MDAHTIGASYRHKRDVCASQVHPEVVPELLVHDEVSDSNLSGDSNVNTRMHIHTDTNLLIADDHIWKSVSTADIV